jgi:hypothetical protein
MTSLTCLQQGSNATTKIENLVKLVLELNCAVPLFEPDNALFPEDPKVQSSLQDFFAVYVDSYLFLVSAFGQDKPCMPAPTT